MWFPRVKIHITNSLSNEYYEIDKWYYIKRFKTKKLYFRYRKDNYIEFVIDSYKNKKDALKNGKILFSNVLFYGYKSSFDFKMGDRIYVTNTYDEWYGCSFEEFKKNEEWFFNTKKNQSDFLGLSVFEANDIDDLNTYKGFHVEIHGVLNYPIDVINWLHNIDYDFKYTEKNQKIFHMFELVEQADTNTQILLLCQILEIMGVNQERSSKAINIIDKYKLMLESENLEESEKNSLQNGLENLKIGSSRKKIKELLKKYCVKDYKTFDKYKLVNDCYKIRSLIIHGEIIESTDDILFKLWDLKKVVIDTFKEWSKHNN